MTRISVESAIIKYIEEVEESNRLGDIMDATFGKEFGKFVNKKVRKIGWNGKFDKKLYGEHSIAPSEWRTNEDDSDNHDLHITFNDIDRLDGIETQYYISSFCGVGGSGVCFELKTQALGQRDWRKLLREETSIINKITKIGFVCDPKKGTLRSPFRIDRDKLSEAFAENNFDEVLQPVGDTIDRILKNRPVLDKLVAAIRKVQHSNGAEG